jgi:hypothetical protein
MKTDIFKNIKIETHTELNSVVKENVRYVVHWIKKFAPDRSSVYTYEMLTDNIIAYSFLYKEEKLISFTSAWKRSFYENNVRILNRYTNLYEDDEGRKITPGRRYLKPETAIIVARQIEACISNNIDFVFMSREGINANLKLRGLCDTLNFSFLTNDFTWQVTDKRYQVAPSESDDAFQYMCYAPLKKLADFTMLNKSTRD